ncbi:WD40 repeat domain-containing protein [Streptomyces sp. NPDC060035]|uniref:WD40 repeat domain-containing protein n=1 Tax=Streptomyces sp. NPDC060035 TaxID=3347044 RepID=UPI003697434F
MEPHRSPTSQLFLGAGRHIPRTGSQSGWHLVRLRQPLRIWDAGSGQPLRTLTEHTGAVSAVEISSQGTWFASAGEDTVIRIWDAATGNLLRT